MKGKLITHRVGKKHHLTMSNEVQAELFDDVESDRSLRALTVDELDYTTDPNPMVREYGLTWNGAICRECQSYLNQECRWRAGEEHPPTWNACGQFQPKP